MWHYWVIDTLTESLKDSFFSYTVPPHLPTFYFTSFSLSPHLRSKDVQNYKVPNDAAAGQLRNGHGSFLQGKHTLICAQNYVNPNLEMWSVPLCWILKGKGGCMQTLLPTKLLSSPLTPPPQVTVFEQEHFQGKCLEFTSECCNIQDCGLDNIRSIRVESGA